MIKAYFNDMAAIWDETIAEKDQSKLEDMAKRLGITPGSMVLDVGTGTGVFVPFILKIIGVSGKLVCIDFAEEMLRRARAKGFEGNIEYICADISDCPLDSERFDAVVCYSSFPHFQNKPKILAEISRLLHKGSKLLICHTSSRSAINEIHHQIPPVQNDLIPEADEIRQLLSAAGFTEVELYDADNSYLVIATKIHVI